MDDYWRLKWTEIFKETKWHFWRYLVFIAIAIFLIFILVSFRDNLLKLLNFPLTEDVKLKYSGLVMVVGFLATAIRSFFDTKNILVGLKTIISRKFKKAYKETYIVKFKEEFRADNIEPILE